MHPPPNMNPLLHWGNYGIIRGSIFWIDQGVWVGEGRGTHAKQWPVYCSSAGLTRSILEILHRRVSARFEIAVFRVFRGLRFRV